MLLLKPVSFRINNYKSISDSGICTLSGDGITVVAGQNEAGKTSILKALRDFDGLPGTPPALNDVVPDHDPSLVPSVVVKFEFIWPDLQNALLDESLALETPLADAFSHGEVELTRDLLTGAFSFEAPIDEALNKIDDAIEADPEAFAAELALQPEGTKFPSNQELFSFLYDQWPSFVYFDSFDDLLPTKTPVDLIQKVTGATTTEVEPDIEPAARNFLLVAGIDLKRVRELALLNDDEKQLKNYLDSRSRAISSDFLDYWKQSVGSRSTISLKVTYSRQAKGAFLLFYAEDGGVTHFPRQRSKGFLWFLSFYLSLTSAGKGASTRRGRFILIDEPGSFLHPKAQHDILDVIQRRVVNDGNLVVYSTHSPYLLPAANLARVRVAFKDQKNKSVIADRLNDNRLIGDVRGDALAPIWDAIGIEVADLNGSSLTDNDDALIVEGITDYYYLHAWNIVLGRGVFEKTKILVANGTPTVPYSVSLAIAYSKRFAVLLDNDDAGKTAAEKLTRDMNIDSRTIVRPHDAAGIEDVFSNADFETLCTAQGRELKAETAKPSALIKRHKIDKVLLARKFSELVSDGTMSATSLSEDSKKAMGDLFDRIEIALRYDAIHKIPR